jgi:hypothetical protein
MSSAADRQRAYRARRNDGRIMLLVEINETDLAQSLILHGLLSETDEDDRCALASAVSRLLDLLPTLPIRRTGQYRGSA